MLITFIGQYPYQFVASGLNPDKNFCVGLPSNLMGDKICIYLNKCEYNMYIFALIVFSTNLVD